MINSPVNEPVTLGPGDGRRIAGGGLDATVKVTSTAGAFASTFEMVVPPGYDVGAHVHLHGEEIFFVLEGELDVLAFEPMDRSVPDWHSWQSRNGAHHLTGGPGSFLYVPPNTPHAFSNPTDRPTRVFFQSSAPGGHENYFVELAEILRNSHGKPSPSVIAALRQRYDIQQLTALDDGRRS